jgi:fibronectin-binding autotransporter adhesin
MRPSSNMANQLAVSGNLKRRASGRGRRTTATILLSACAAAVAIDRSSQATSAATALWDGGTIGSGTTWLADANWSPDLNTGTGPGATDIAQFDALGSAATIGIDLGAATNNGANNEAIGQILLSGGISRTINNSATSVAGILTLNGSVGTLLSNSSSNLTLTLANGTQTMGVRLAATGDVAVANSGASIVISSIVSETGGAQGLSKSGAGMLTLSAANTYTGAVSVNAGTLSIGTIGAIGVAQALGQGTAAVNLGNAVTSGALLYTGGGATTDHTFVLGDAGGQVGTTTNNLTFTGNISGSGSLTKISTGALILSGAKTFTGNVNIQSGVLSGNQIASFGAGSTITLGSASATGTLQYSGSSGGMSKNVVLAGAGSIQSLNNTLTINGGVDTTASGYALTVGGASNVTIGTLGITGAGSLTKNGTGTVTLAAANNYTGATTVSAGTLLISGASGAITGTSSPILVAGGSLLKLDNTINNNDRLPDGTAISLDSSGFEFSADLNTPTVETAGALQIAGSTTVSATTAVAGAGGASITFASLSRNSGSTVNFNVLAPGQADLKFSSAPALNDGIIGGYATANTTDWATLSGGAVVPLATYNTAADPNTWSAADNVNAVTSGSLTASNTINSLKITGSPVAISIAAGQTLNIDAGGVLAVGGGHSINGAGSVTAGSTAGAELFALVPTSGDVLTISAAIVNNVGGAVGLTKGGAGTVVLDSASNSYTGNTSIAQGLLQLSSTGVIPSASNVDVASGATFDVNGQTRTIGALSGAGAVTLGAGSLTAGGSNASTSYSGVMSGAGSFIKAGNGTMTLIAGTASTYAGPTTINGGTLIVPADNRLGAVPGAATTNINLNAATLQLPNAITLGTNRGIALGSASSTIDTPNSANSTSYAGIISGTGTLTKTGAGTLVIVTAQSTYTGGTIIKPGTISVTTDRNFGAIPGSLQLANITLDGGVIRFTSSGGTDINANRGMTVTANGGTVDYSQSSGTPNINYRITSSTGSFTKLGLRTILSNIAQPTMNGDLIIGQGRWNTQIAGAAGNGTIRMQSIADSFAQLGIGGTNLGLTVTLTNPIVLNPTGNGVNSFEVNNSTPTQNNLILNGAISGPGGLTKGQVAGTTGILTLGGTNTYSGPTTINLGTVSVGTSSNLGDGSVTNGIVFGGGTLQATGTVASGARNVTLNSAGGTVDTNVNSVTLGNVDGGFAFTKNSTGELTVNHVRASTLTVNNGRLTAASSGTAGGVSVVNSTALGATAQLDLKNNHLIDHTTGVGTWTGSAYTGITGSIASGRNGGAWNGNGIITSSGSGNFTTLGVATAAQVKGIAATATATWAGQTVTGSDALAMYTYGGDANLDGKINVDDYTRIDFNVPLGASGWYNGDFNYDGKINVDDYTIIDFNVGIQGSPFFTAGGAGSGAVSGLSGVAAVPEPASLGLVVASAAGIFARRRRRYSR